MNGTARPAWLLLALVTAFSSAAADDTAAAPPAAEHVPPHAQLTPQITADQVLTRIAYLASDDLEGRETGTKGGTMAEEYVASEFRRFGLEPLADAGRSPFSDVPIQARAVADKSGIEITGADGRTERVGGDAGAIPFSFSKSGEASGGLVFAGFGLRCAKDGYDDYEGLDCKGRVVLALRHGPGELDEKSPWYKPMRRPQDVAFAVKARNAADAGAVALLLVNDVHHKEDRLPVDSPGAEAAIPVFGISRATADKLLAPLGRTLAQAQAEIDLDRKPRSAPVPATTVHVTATLTTAIGRNVVFVRRGTDEELKDEAVLVCAHMDHIGLGGFAALDPQNAGQVHNGADDNASGTAALLEVAEAMAAGPPTRRTLIFAGWCGEEKGLLGSVAFTQRPLWDMKKIAVCVNMDMVGRYRTGAEGSGLFACGMPTATGTEERITRLAKAHDLVVTPSWEAWEQSDHFAFYVKGVPSLFLHTGLHADYHCATDDWWKIKAEPEARIAQMVVDLTRELADAAQRPAFAKKPQQPILGVRPDNADGKGVRLVEVFPGYGAAAGGLKAGDVVTKLGAKAIANVNDLREFLAGSKVTDVADCTFLRDGKEQTTKVALMSRE